MGNTIKQQVNTAVKEEINKLRKQGVVFVRFKDIQFETEQYIIKCHSPYFRDGWACYEVRLAWGFMKENFDYDKIKLEGENGNAKFFKILNS
jgi:hypothetical protein